MMDGNMLRRLALTIAITCSLLLPVVSNAAVWTLISMENCGDVCGIGVYECSDCNPNPFTPVCPVDGNPAGQPCDGSLSSCWWASGFWAREYICQ